MMEKMYFYDMKEIEFVWNGEWNDPTIIYKNKEMNYYELEDTMYSLYQDENVSMLFIEWMALNHDLVIEMVENMYNYEG